MNFYMFNISLYLKKNPIPFAYVLYFINYLVTPETLATPLVLWIKVIKAFNSINLHKAFQRLAVIILSIEKLNFTDFNLGQVLK